MNWDAEDLLHGGEDFGHFFYAPISSMLRDNDGLVNICKDSMPDECKYVITGVKLTAKAHTLTHSAVKRLEN